MVQQHGRVEVLENKVVAPVPARVHAAQEARGLLLQVVLEARDGRVVDLGERPAVAPHHVGAEARDPGGKRVLVPAQQDQVFLDQQGRQLQGAEVAPREAVLVPQRVHADLLRRVRDVRVVLGEPRQDQLQDLSLRTGVHSARRRAHLRGMLRQQRVADPHVGAVRVADVKPVLLVQRRQVVRRHKARPARDARRARLASRGQPLRLEARRLEAGAVARTLR